MRRIREWEPAPEGLAGFRLCLTPLILIDFHRNDFHHSRAAEGKSPPPRLPSRSGGKQNCSPLFLEQFWLRLPRVLSGEAGLSPEAIAARTLGGNGLRRGRSPAAAGWAAYLLAGWEYDLSSFILI